MPIHKGYDNKKHKYYYQWGNQKKYYFTNQQNEIIAYNKAVRQARAIYYSYG